MVIRLCILWCSCCSQETYLQSGDLSQSGSQTFYHASQGDQTRPQCKKHDKGQHIEIIERGKMRLKSREPCSHSVHWTILGPNRTVTSWGNCFRLWPAYPNIQVLEDSTAQIDGIDIVMPGLSSFHALTCRLAICGWMKIKRCASPAWNNSSCSIPHLRFWNSMVQRWTKLRHTLAAKFWPGYNK